MNDFVIFSDSSSDLPKDLINKFDLKIIPFSVSFDGKTYFKENLEISLEEFYKHLTESPEVKTSLPSIDTYITSFEPFLKDKLDILCVCVSSNLSGSYQSAVNAKNIMAEKYPDRKIIIVDSMQVSGSQGLLTLQALKMRTSGLGINLIAQKLEKLKEIVNIYFIPDTLEYLKKGGRISTLSAALGGLLNIKPVLFLENGSVNVYSKVRGKNKAVLELISCLKNIEDNINNYDIMVGSALAEEDAQNIIKKIEQMFNIKINFQPFKVGVAVGAHVGPNALGLAFIKKYENL